MKTIRTFSLLLLSLLPGMSVAQTWTAVGPSGGWINTFSRDGSGDVYAGTYFGGIYRTSNNGDTWVQIYNDTLLMDPLSIAFNSGGNIFVGASPGFLRSTNGGTSWQKINNALNTRTVEALVMLANGTILAGNWGGGGVFRSTDNGTTFAAANNGLTNTQVRSLALKQSNGYLFAGTYGGGVFRSTNDGTSWSAVNNGIPGSSLMIWVGVSPPGDIYATGGTTIYRSTNNGDTWTNLAPPAATYNEVAFAPAGLYAATSNGVTKSTDGGATWTQQVGLPDMQFTRIIASESRIIAGSGGLGTYRSNGSTGPSDAWTQIVNGMRNTHVVAIDRAANGDLYAATLLAGVFRSTDDGLTWFSASSGIAPSDRLSSLAVSPTTGTVFAGGVGFRGYRSTNRGATWTVVTQLGNASTVACNVRGHVFAGVGSFVRRSTNDGVAWTGSEPSFQISTVADLECDGDTVYAATGVGSGSGTSRGVYRSTDNGNSWGTFNAGLTNLNVTAVTVSTTPGIAATGPSCARVLSGTWGSGILEFENGTWTTTEINAEFMKGFARVPAGGDKVFGIALALLVARDDICAWDLIFIPDRVEQISGHVIELPSNEVVPLVGTNGGGILRGTNVISTSPEITDKPEEFSLHQNYPNPFNPSTRITYRLKDRGPVSLRVFDMLGREVAALVDAVQSPGEYVVDVDGRSLASGVYFYRMQAGEFKATRKFVLMR